MAIDLEFISPTDKPALLAATTPELIATGRAVLTELDYKVHMIADHEEFTTRFAQIQYQVVIIDEFFAADSPEKNLTLQRVQTMPMGQRRHATFFLIGPSFESLDPMQGFHQSVHAVINTADLPSLKKILQQVIGDAAGFLHVYRETQTRLAQG